MRKEEGACQAQVGNWATRRQGQGLQKYIEFIFSLDVQFQICLLH